MEEHALSLAELTALSVPATLRFLLAVENDVFLCVYHMGLGRDVAIEFPKLGPNFEALVVKCAMRFGLGVYSGHASTVVQGAGSLPLLRYSEYLPGVQGDEVRACLKMPPKHALHKVEGKSNTFRASFLDYTDFVGVDGDIPDPAVGHYQTLVRGLPLATHAHLVRISITRPTRMDDAVTILQGMSGWSQFTLRCDGPVDNAQNGIFVLPSAQDAAEMFERYEDEESGDDEDGLPFVLRPVSPLTAVPSIEDGQLRRLREQRWAEALTFWETFDLNRHVVCVANLFPQAGKEDVLRLFPGYAGLQVVVTEDASPSHRRRAFLTFPDSDSVLQALAEDGRNTQGRALRVQISPPYLTHERRGTDITATAGRLSAVSQQGRATTSSRPAASPSISPTAAPDTPGQSRAVLNPDAKEFKPKTVSPGASPQVPHAADPKPPPPRYDQAPPPYKKQPPPPPYSPPPPYTPNPPTYLNPET